MVISSDKTIKFYNSLEIYWMKNNISTKMLYIKLQILDQKKLSNNSE